MRAVGREAGVARGAVVLTPADERWLRMMTDWGSGHIGVNRNQITPLDQWYPRIDEKVARQNLPFALPEFPALDGARRRPGQCDPGGPRPGCRGVPDDPPDRPARHP